MKKQTMKLLAVLLAAAMMLSLAACSTSSEGSSGSTGSSADSSSSTPSSQTADPGKTYEWILGSTYADPVSSPEYNGYGLGVQYFAEELDKRTDGAMKITYHMNGVLGGDVELFNMVRTNEIQLYHGTPFTTVDGRFGISKMPMIFHDFEQAKELLCNPDGELYQMVSDALEEQGLVQIFQDAGTFRSVLSNKHQVVSISDLSDLNFRSYEDAVASAFWSGITNISIMPFSEVYTALQTRTVDAMELADIQVIALKFYEVIDYFTDVEWQWQGVNLSANGEAWNELPADMQQLMLDIGLETVDYEFEIQEADRKTAYDAMAEKGVTVHQLTDEERQEWTDYAQTVLPQLRDVIGADYYDQAMDIIAASNEAHGY